MDSEKVSIIMGIYNCENTLSEAIKSIFNQTYTNWELIMCDDGSTDSTFQIADEFKNNHPDKIILIKNQKNKGLNYTLNKCLDNATGKYIARMDADDISLPTRLEKEVQFLNSNLGYDFVSTPMICFDENGEWGICSVKEKPSKKDIVKSTPFCHAPCMVRSRAYFDVGGYSVDKKLLRVEDYHLWVKMFYKGHKGYNLQEPLYKVRDDRNATNRRKFKYRLNEAYVKHLAIQKLKLPFWNYIYVLKPIIMGFLPSCIYEALHRKKLKK